VLGARPPSHIGADLCDELQRRVGSDPVNLREINPAGQVMQHGSNLEGRFDALPGRTGRRERTRWGDRHGQRADVGFDDAVAPGDLSLAGVVEFQILLERKEQLRPVVAGQRGGDLGGCGPTPAVAKPRQVRRVAFPRDNGANDLSPVRPVMSLITKGSWRFICTSAFCIRWTCIAASSTKVCRCRMYVRRVTIAAVGRKLACSRPTLCRSRSHSASDTSLFRPGRLRTCRAFTKWTDGPRASRIS
jgi:hypothetical protein